MQDAGDSQRKEMCFAKYFRTMTGSILLTYIACIGNSYGYHFSIAMTKLNLTEFKFCSSSF